MRLRFKPPYERLAEVVAQASARSIPESQSGSRLLDHFGAAYVINLATRKDRLKSVLSEFARVGWSVGAGRIEVFAACTFDSPAGFDSIGVRGCFHSHLECLSKGLRAQRGDVLMLEDDVAFSSALPSLTPALLRRLAANDWDIIYFGHEETGAIPRATAATREVTFRRLLPHERVLQAHFYAVRYPTLTPLIGYLETLLTRPAGHPLGAPMSVDGALNDFRRANSSLRVLLCIPKLGWQRPSRSDLSPGLFDRLKMLTPAMRIARDVKHLIARTRS